MAMLEVRNLHKRYSGISAVDSVSFIARAGEVTGYLGANGSGKSNRSVQGQSRFRAVPIDELVDRMAISALAVGTGQAVQHCRL
jgi:ABC-type hemin transport system ATPase subunit